MVEQDGLLGLRGSCGARRKGQKCLLKNLSLCLNLWLAGMGKKELKGLLPTSVMVEERPTTSLRTLSVLSGHLRLHILWTDASARVTQSCR